MCEYFERLDLNNYSSEFSYALHNDLFTFSEWLELFKENKISNEEFEEVESYFNAI